jgi:beta-glucosidase/6-phospho-beta-glucosidase/beta-galactosidase
MENSIQLPNSPHFRSFMMCGFECTYALAEEGRRFDLLHASRHDEVCAEDYQLIKERGVLTVREGLSWSQIDKGNNVYEFSRFEPMMEVAQSVGIQQIWDLSHFDFPEDLDPFTDQFSQRYGEYAKRAIEVIRKYQKGTLYICPMNEVSFFAWMCDRGLWAPYQKGKGTEFKKQLVKTAISAMRSIWEVDKDVQFIHIDPYMYRQPLHKKNEMEKEFCRNFNEEVKYHSWDMISGKKNPELGGDPKYLNIIGINYYFYNQQQVGIDAHNPDNFVFRSIPLKSKLRVPFRNILNEVYERYGVPILLSETGSYRDRRPEWWKYILEEADSAIQSKLPLYGVCSYPTLDIKKGAGFIIPKSGLWDFDQKDKTFRRIPHEPTWEVIQPFIQKWQKKL